MVKTFDWNKLIQDVAGKLPPMQYRAWLEPARFLKVTETNLIITVPTDFSRNWIMDHYRDIFKESIRNLFGIQLDLQIELQEDVLDSPEVEAAPEETENTPSSASRVPRPETPSTPATEPAASSPSYENFTPSGMGDHLTAISVRDLKTPVVKTLGQPLNAKHTFDSYVVGASNQFAAAAARAVAEQPASQYNPLFIYSSAGLGKTHLLNAIGNYLIRVNPKIRICYLSAEAFVNELIESLRHERMSQFRQKFRDSYEVLLMDDIQFIAGKGRSQEEFFHTFNALHSSRRQLVVTSDKSPKDIPGLEERIRTRFEWGLIADIQPPEIETRIAILRAKAELDDIFLPQDVALFLASNVKSNVRELEGALIKLGAQASLSGVEISLDLAKNVLKNIIKEPTQGVSPDTILDTVSRHFSVRIADLKSKERSRRVALPRQITMYLLRKYCEKSYPDIGILLGGKDHSTVLHGVKTITSDMDRKPDLRRHIEEIQNKL